MVDTIELTSHRKSFTYHTVQGIWKLVNNFVDLYKYLLHSTILGKCKTGVPCPAIILAYNKHVGLPTTQQAFCVWSAAKSLRP